VPYKENVSRVVEATLMCNHEEELVALGDKVRSPIPSVYTGFYIVCYKDIGEFQILYSQDICW
jgi:hypothetical protein